MFKLIFWIFILFLALSYFGISIETIINSPAGRANLTYLIHVSYQGWQWLSAHLLSLKKK